MTKIFATVDQVTINLPYVGKMKGQDSALVYAEKLHFEEILGEASSARGLNFYKSAISFYKGQVKLMWHDNKRSQGILLYFTATGYRAWKSLSQLHGYSFDLLSLINFMLENEAKWFTRFDDAIDVFDSDLTVEDLYRQIDSGEVLVLDRLSRRLKTKYQKFYGIDRKITGFTIGARSSDCFLRVYDKKIEQSNENSAYLDLAKSCKSWIRFEFEAKHDKAKAILNDLALFAMANDKAGLQQQLVGYLVNQWKLTDKNKELIPLWQQLITLADGKGAIPSLEPKLTDRLVQELKWFLTGGAAGVFYRIANLFGDTGKVDFWLYMLEYISKPNTVGHYAIPKNINSDLELIRKQHPNIENIKFYLESAIEEIEKDK